MLETLPRFLVFDFLSTLTPYVNTRPTHYLTTLWSLAIYIYPLIHQPQQTEASISLASAEFNLPPWVLPIANCFPILLSFR